MLIDKVIFDSYLMWIMVCLFICGVVVVVLCSEIFIKKYGIINVVFIFG